MDLFYISTPLPGGFDLNAVCRVFQVAVPDFYITDSAGHLTSQGKPVPEQTFTVKDADVLAGPVDDIPFRIFACFDSHRVIPGVKGAVKDRTVPGRIWVPPVPVPDIPGLEMTAVGHDILRINHVHIPACPVF